MALDKNSAAVARYRAMAGWIKKMPRKAARRAMLDQKRHGERYLTRRRGRVVCDPLQMVRFLVDVCGLTLREASGAVRTGVWAGGCGSTPKGRDSRSVALRLYRETGDVLEAVALARFFGWALGDRNGWDQVRINLSTTPFKAESTGIENWQ